MSSECLVKHIVWTGGKLVLADVNVGWGSQLTRVLLCLQLWTSDNATDEAEVADAGEN